MTNGTEWPWAEEIARRVRMAQIIVLALVGGCVMFLAVALMASGGGGRDGQETPTLVYVAILLTAGAILARLVVPAAIMTRGRQQIAEGTWQVPGGRADAARLEEFLEKTGDAGRLWLLFLTQTIIGAALLEGVAFFWIIVSLVTQSAFALGAGVVLIVGVLLHFPTKGRVRHWIEGQLRMVEEQRALRR